MLQYMTIEAATAIFRDLPEIVNKAKTTKKWAPTWFESQHISEENDEQGEDKKSKRKKDNNDDQRKSEQMEHSVTHHTHIQQANKVLSKAASNDNKTYIQNLSSHVSNLQIGLAEMTTMMGEFKEQQHRDQNHSYLFR
jgi:hypothetical protein